MNRVKDQRLIVIEKQRRMGKAYVDGLFPDGEYQRQKKLLEMELESLVVPAANAAEEAGNLIINLKSLWAEANLEEKRKLLFTMLDAVYVDARKTKSIVATETRQIMSWTNGCLPYKFVQFTNIDKLEKRRVSTS